MRKAWMKVGYYRTKRRLKRPKQHERRTSRGESFGNAVISPGQIHTYAELRQQIHNDLRVQHPEWVLPNGDCPVCDAYEARLMELLETSKRREPNEWVVALHRALELALK
jgi:hypothetical protein